MPTGADDNFVNSAAAAKATLDTGLVRSLFALREGFGANTTGGLNGEIYVVTNLNDSGPGSLRFAAQSDKPLWIIFAPSLQGQTITLDSTIYLGANKTIDGRGSDITLINHRHHDWRQLGRLKRYYRWDHDRDVNDLSRTT